MAFNFMSFLGGAAGAGSEYIDTKNEAAAAAELTKEERQWQIATEGRRDAAARKLQRDNKRNETADMLGTLTSLGLSEEQASKALSKGKGAFEIHKSIGVKALEMGIPFSDLLALNNGVIKDTESTLNSVNATPIKAASSNASYWNNENVAALYGKVPKAAVSLDLQLAKNAKDQLTIIQSSNGQGPLAEKEAASLARLQEAEKFLLEKHNAFKSNEKGTDTSVTITSRKTLTDLITKNYAIASKDAGFGWNAEQQMEIAWTGNMGGGFSSKLNAIYGMEQTIGLSNDKWVNDTLAVERAGIQRGLDRHAQSVMQSQNKSDAITIQNFASMEDYGIAVNSGAISKPGTVSTVGGVPYIFTGVPNSVYDEAAQIYKPVYGMP